MFRRKIKPVEAEELPLVQPAQHARQFEKYVFICGLHRSGTTLIERSLRARYEVDGLKAPVPESEGQHLQDVFPSARAFGGPGRFAFAPEMRTALPEEAEIPQLRERLLKCWTPWIEGEARTFAEKSPPNLTKIPYLRRLFPGAKFVIVTRHPVAVAAATLKWARSSLEELIFHWHVAHQIALEDEGPDCIRLGYENFCDDPHGRLLDLADFLGLEKRSSMRLEDERFEIIRNSNAKYLNEQPARTFGKGSWSEFGYRI